MDDKMKRFEKEEQMNKLAKSLDGNLASFALIISFLIFFTVIFEHGKEAVVEVSWL